MEHKKNSNLGFSLIGGGCISFLIFLCGTPCMAILLYLLMLVSGDTIVESGFSIIILGSPFCGGIFGIISLIAAPFILHRLNIPKEITTPAMKGAFGIGTVAFVILWLLGAVGTHIYNLSQQFTTLADRVTTDAIAGVLCGLPLGMFAAVIGFLIIYFRRSRQAQKETQQTPL